MSPFYALKQRLHSHLTRLLGSLTPCLPEWIDALANGCDDETSFPLRVLVGWSIALGIYSQGYVGSDNKIEFLGRADPRRPWILRRGDTAATRLAWSWKHQTALNSS